MKRCLCRNPHGPRCRVSLINCSLFLWAIWKFHLVLISPQRYKEALSVDQWRDWLRLYLCLESTWAGSWCPLDFAWPEVFPARCRPGAPTQRGEMLQGGFCGCALSLKEKEAEIEGGTVEGQSARKSSAQGQLGGHLYWVAVGCLIPYCCLWVSFKLPVEFLAEMKWSRVIFSDFVRT